MWKWILALGVLACLVIAAGCWFFWYKNDATQNEPIMPSRAPVASAQPITKKSLSSATDSPGGASPSAPILPDSLMQSITKTFPDYHVPTKEEQTGYWSKKRTDGALPYYCVGDFSGDGLADSAVVLIGKTDWRLVIFEKSQDGYRVAYVARPKMLQELGPYDAKTQAVATPQDLVLHVVKKGETWAPEAGDQPSEVKLETDGVGFDLFQKLKYAELDSMNLISLEDGHYRQHFSETLVEISP